MKGISGKIVTVIITLIIAIIAIAILVYFFNISIPFISELIDNIIEGFKKWICENLPWYTKLLGCPI